MRGKDSFIIFWAGLILHIFDFVSDVIVAVGLYRNNERNWFVLTVFFILLPIVIITLAGLQPPRKCGSCRLRSFVPYFIDRYIEEYLQWKRQYERNKRCGKDDCNKSCEECKAYFMVKPETARLTYEFTALRHIETVTESAPQFCLQVYIMLRRWSFPVHVLISTGFSLLALTWGFTALERARKKKFSSTPDNNQNSGSVPNPHPNSDANTNQGSSTDAIISPANPNPKSDGNINQGSSADAIINLPDPNLKSAANIHQGSPTDVIINPDPKPKSDANTNQGSPSDAGGNQKRRCTSSRRLALFFLWQLFAIVSRVSAIIFCAYTLKLNVLWFVLLRMILSPILYNFWFGKILNELVDVSQFPISAYLFLSNVPDPLFRLKKPKKWRYKIFKMNVYHALLNIVTLVVSVFAPVQYPCDTTHLYDIMWIATSAVAGGIFIGNIFCFFYVRCFPLNSVEPNNDCA